MKTILSLTVALAILTGCTESGADVTDTMINLCVDGVQYWYNDFADLFAPRVDPETLSFVRCEK